MFSGYVCFEKPIYWNEPAGRMLNKKKGKKAPEYYSSMFMANMKIRSNKIKPRLYMWKRRGLVLYRILNHPTFTIIEAPVSPAAQPANMP